MLVLTRKPAEAIQVDGEITITVLEVRGGRVRLGIEAPKSVRIRRTEVIEANGSPPLDEPAERSSSRSRSAVAHFGRQSALR